MPARANRALGVAALAFLAVSGCKREPPASRLVVPSGTVEAPPADPALRWVVAASPLRREPGDAGKGRPGEKPPQGTVLHGLQRGEQVRLLEERDGLARVRDAEGAEGWVRAAALLPVEGAPAATVLVEAWAFEQPDLLATNARRRVAPGTLLLVRKRGELFTEVDVGTGQNAWVLTDRVTSRPEDLAASRAVERARLLQRAGKVDEARAVLAALRESTPDSPLVPVLAVELGELPPESPSTVPGAVPVPAPDAVPAANPPALPVADTPRPP